MMTNKITVFPATSGWKRHWSKTTAPPCRLCALAVPIEAGANHGSWCLWYRIRLPSAELQEQLSDVRRHCLRDGNNFQWPLRGFTTSQLLDLRMKLTDWYLQRNTLSIQRLAIVISLVLSGVAIAVSVAALFLRPGI